MIGSPGRRDGFVAAGAPRCLRAGKRFPARFAHAAPEEPDDRAPVAREAACRQEKTAERERGRTPQRAPGKRCAEHYHGGARF